MTIAAAASDQSRRAAGRDAPDTVFSEPAEAFGSHARAVFGVAWLYLLVPTLVVLARFEHWAIALPVLAAGIVSTRSMLRGWTGTPGGAAVSLWSTWPYALLAALLVWMSGTLPPFGENLDWAKHYAIFNELIAKDWPPAIPTDDGLATLRYSLSYYVVPAVVAKYCGIGWLNPAIFAWTTLGTYLALLLAFGARRMPLALRWLVCLAFLLFSGADIVGTLANDNWHPLFLHFEWWADFGQLSSLVTGLFWTPQHALSGWIGAFLLLRFPLRILRGGAVLLAAVSIWSPFSAVGLMPVFAWAAATRGPRTLLSRINLTAGLVLLCAAGFYLTRGVSQRIPFGFIWDAKAFGIGLWVQFVLLEFVLLVLALLIVRPQSRALILWQGAFLLFLSLFNVGMNNDLLMRGSVPALAILALVAADALALAPNSARKLPLAVCLAAGLATPFGEIARAFVLPRMADSRTVDLPDIFEGMPHKLEGQYVVPGYDGPVAYRTVRQLSGLKFSSFGTADFDLARRRIESPGYADAALVSDPILLAPGVYRLDLTLDWNVQAPPGADHGAHVSLHGKRILIPIAPSRAAGRRVTTYFRTRGEPVQIALGLGGWGRGRGFVQLDDLQLRSVSFGR